MRHGTVLFLFLCPFIVVSGALAQDSDADSGILESLDPTMECMQSCSQTHEMCVSTATFMDCINNDPACASVRPRDAEIMAAFCTACGAATVGCGSDDATPGSASSAGGSPGPPSGGAVSPSRARTRPPTEAERERSALARAREICQRQRGIWQPETVVLMPDGTARLGVCRTPEGVELMQMIDDEHTARAEADEALNRRLIEEERARVAADTIHSRDISLIEDGDHARDARIADLIAQVTCLRAGVTRISLDRFDPTLREQMRSAGFARDGYYECPEIAASAAETASSSSASAPLTHRAPEEHPRAGGEGWGLHLRLQVFGHVGFTPIHPTLAQVRGTTQSVPVGLGFDATVFGAIANGWYLEGGAGLSYDWPDFQPFATNARVWYHAGLAAYVVPVLSIGFGYLGSDRFRPSMMSAYSFHGAYVDLTAHIRMTSDVTDPAFVITLRGGFGAAIRPAAPIAPDGLLQLMAGVEF